jgi:hypothetical protein
MEQQPSSGQERKEYTSKTNRFWGGGLFIGTVLIILGLYFIGCEMGWFSYDFPFWAVIIIAAGIFMVTGALRQRPK